MTAELGESVKVAPGEHADFNEEGEFICICGTVCWGFEPAQLQGNLWVLSEEQFLKSGIEPIGWCGTCGRIVNADTGAVITAVARVQDIR